MANHVVCDVNAEPRRLLLISDGKQYLTGFDLDILDFVTLKRDEVKNLRIVHANLNLVFVDENHPRPNNLYDFHKLGNGKMLFVLSDFNSISTKVKSNGGGGRGTIDVSELNDLIGLLTE